MGLTNFRELSWTQLSSGYKLRFEIAMALVWDPAVLILDEPLANLDMQAQELLLQDLRNIADSLRHPISIILSSQQLHEVETVADQIIFLKNGNAIFNGNLNEFRNQETIRTFEINGNFKYYDLQKFLSGWEDLKIEQSASCFTISCSGKHTKEDLFRLLIENKCGIEYFRNISGSTKKLFSDKY
jgi:ABC-2 type transport system ATP-binding protein